MAFHAACNTALRNVNILQSFKSESAQSIKLLSLKRVDSESLKRIIFKTDPKTFHVDVTMKH